MSERVIEIILNMIKNKEFMLLLVIIIIITTNINITNITNIILLLIIILFNFILLIYIIIRGWEMNSKKEKREDGKTKIERGQT